MEAPGCGNLGKKNRHKNRKNYGYFHPYSYIFLKQLNENRTGAQSVFPYSQIPHPISPQTAKKREPRLVAWPPKYE